MGLRWGVLGFGWVARDFAAPAMLQAGARLAAVADPDPDARAAGVALGARAYPDVAGLLSDPEVQAIYVATPNHLHRAGVEAAAAAGRPVLCEKPMAASVADAEVMARAVNRAGVAYGTAFDQRHHPAHGAMRTAIAAGVGRPHHRPFALSTPAGSGADFAADNWRADPVRAGGGAMMDLAPHGLDLIDFLAGEPVVEVAAMTQRRVQSYAVDDGALLIGRTAGGVLAQLHVAYNCPEGLPRRRLEVVGSTGQLVAEDTMGQVAGGDVWLLDGAGGERRRLAVPDAAASPFTRQMAAFARHVLDAPDPAFDLARDLHTMRLLDRAYASATP